MSPSFSERRALRIIRSYYEGVYAVDIPRRTREYVKPLLDLGALERRKKRLYLSMYGRWCANQVQPNPTYALYLQELGG